MKSIDTLLMLRLKVHVAAVRAQYALPRPTGARARRARPLARLGR